MKNQIILGLAAASMVLGACSAEGSGKASKATPYLSVEITETGTPESCELKIYSSIARSTGLHIYEYDRYVNGRKQMKSMAKLWGHDKIDYVDDETISGVFSEAACSTYDVEWKNMKCFNDMKAPMECPDVVFSGKHSLRSIKITPASK